MRRIYALVLVAVLLMLSGCGNAASSSQSPSFSYPDYNKDATVVGSWKGGEVGVDLEVTATFSDVSDVEMFVSSPQTNGTIVQLTGSYSLDGWDMSMTVTDGSSGQSYEYDAEISFIGGNNMYVYFPEDYTPFGTDYFELSRTAD